MYTKYTFGVHEETGTVWRQAIGKKEKEPGMVVDQPNAADEAAVMAVWPDGQMAFIDDCTCAEMREMQREKTLRKTRS